jgi:hypothetical protein
MIRPAEPICDIWHRHIHERKLGGLTSLYADDAVLKSTVVLVLEGHTDGFLTGKEALTRTLLRSLPRCQRSRLAGSPVRQGQFASKISTPAASFGMFRDSASHI